MIDAANRAHNPVSLITDYIKSVTYHTELKCTSCAFALKKSLIKKFKNDIDVTIDFPNQQTTIKYNSNNIHLNDLTTFILNSGKLISNSSFFVLHQT